jgi:hypothetical protein
MGFKRIAVEAAPTDTAPPVRVRAPVCVDTPPPPPPTIATYALDLTFTLPEHSQRLHDLAKAMLRSDGMSGPDIKAQLKANDMIDIGECLKVVLRPIVQRMVHHVGCECEKAQVYLEVPCGTD